MGEQEEKFRATIQGLLKESEAYGRAFGFSDGCRAIFWGGFIGWGAVMAMSWWDEGFRHLGLYIAMANLGAIVGGILGYSILIRKAEKLQKALKEAFLDGVVS